MAHSLGSAADRVVVIGSEGNDTLAAGGLSLNSDGDVDVTFATIPAQMELQGTRNQLPHRARRLRRRPGLPRRPGHGRGPTATS